MKKLYVVDVQHTVYVMAEDEKGAEREAVKGIHDCGDAPTLCASEMTCGPVDPSWRGSIPFGSDDDRTVNDILNSNAQKS